MGFTLISMAVAIAIRIPSLYVALSQQGYDRLEIPKLFMLALFSALLGFIMPATGLLDIGGVLFRVMLFAVIIMVLMKLEFFDALTVVIIAAIIESIIILALIISPVSFLVAGMSPLTIP